MHEAARYGNSEAIAVLAAAGADVNVQAEDRRTPLFFAVEQKHVIFTGDLSCFDISCAWCRVLPAPLMPLTLCWWLMPHPQVETVAALVSLGADRESKDRVTPHRPPAHASLLTPHNSHCSGWHHPRGLHGG